VRASAQPISPGRLAPLELLRIRQWAHFLVLPLAAFEPAAGWPRLGLGVALTALALGYAYGLNAISDRVTDLDARKNPLAGIANPLRSAAALVAGCGVAALGLAFTGGRVATEAIALSLLAATVYSVGPRWKATPGLGTTLNAVIFAPLLLCTAPRVGASPWLPLELTTFCALLLQNQLLHERADAAEDSAAGVRSTALRVGPRAASAVALMLGAAGAALACLLAPVAGGAAAAGAALLAGSLVATRGPGPLPARRATHRWVAFAGGALLFVVSRLA